MLLRPFADFVQVRLPRWVVMTPGGALFFFRFPPPFLPAALLNDADFTFSSFWAPWGLFYNLPWLMLW